MISSFAGTSSSLRFARVQNASHRCGNPIPFGNLRRQLATAFGGKSIESCPPVVVGYAPFRVDPSPILEPLQREIERSVVHQKCVVRLTLYGAGDPLAVLRPE